MRSVDRRSRPIYDSGNLYIEPQDGSTIRLTIDATLQEICEKVMRECLEVNQAESAFCLISDVYTGAVLAMCMRPDYDPNDPPRDDVEALTALMRITAISDLYEPGSTFKILDGQPPRWTAARPRRRTASYCSGEDHGGWGHHHAAGDSPHKARRPWRQALQNALQPGLCGAGPAHGGGSGFTATCTAFGLGSKPPDIDLPGEERGAADRLPCIP